MVVGVKDMCYPTFLINPALFVDNEDLERREKAELAIDPVVKLLLEEICLKDDLGLDTKELYNKLEAIYNIIEYLFALRNRILENYVCGVDLDADSTKEEFKYDCVRESLNCRYNLGSLFDKLADIIKIPSGRLGINYMTINGNTCNNIFKVHKLK